MVLPRLSTGWQSWRLASFVEQTEEAKHQAGQLVIASGINALVRSLFSEKRFDLKRASDRLEAEMSGIPPDTWRPPTVTIETTMGAIVLELYWKHAPKTCKNFAELAKRGYYSNTRFHRIIKDFMVQGGDPTGTGRGGASIFGKQFEDEIHSELKFSGAGILAMANAGPNTNGSQFFLTLGETQWLDGKHTIFGRVRQGMGVVNRIGMVETNAQDRPADDIKILRAAVTD